MKKTQSKSSKFASSLAAQDPGSPTLHSSSLLFTYDADEVEL
jgi:hypothetical protein